MIKKSTKHVILLILALCVYPAVYAGKLAPSLAITQRSWHNCHDAHEVALSIYNNPKFVAARKKRIKHNAYAQFGGLEAVRQLPRAEALAIMQTIEKSAEQLFANLGEDHTPNQQVCLVQWLLDDTTVTTDKLEVACKVARDLHKKKYIDLAATVMEALEQSDEYVPLHYYTLKESPDYSPLTIYLTDPGRDEEHFNREDRYFFRPTIDDFIILTFPPS